MSNEVNNKKGIKDLILKILIYIFLIFLFYMKIFSFFYFTRSVNIWIINLNGIPATIYKIIELLIIFLSLFGIIFKNSILKNLAIFYFIYDTFVRLGFTINNMFSDRPEKINDLIYFIIFSILELIFIFFLKKQKNWDSNIKSIFEKIIKIYNSTALFIITIIMDGILFYLLISYIISFIKLDSNTHILVSLAICYILTFSLKYIAYYHKKGTSLIKIQNYNDAIPMFEKSYNFFNKYKWLDIFRNIIFISGTKNSYREMALTNIADCYSKIDQCEKAKEFYIKALKEFPNSKVAKKSLEILMIEIKEL
jgi:hypothetical protein